MPDTRNTLAAILSLAFLLPALSACSATGVAVGAGAGAAVAASQERGLTGTMKDTRIRAAINILWLKQDSDMYSGLGLAVHEGRVLATGVVRSEEERAVAVRLAWQATGVKEVINEIAVVPSGRTKDYARDTWITAQLKTKFLFDKAVTAINYSVNTVNYTVYLFGIAQDKVELERVINHARNVKFVRRVVNHVLLKSDPRRKS
jgi:osmotically-inducible protein OsmY